MRGTPPPWVPATALYVVALLPRLALAWTRPYGDEAHHYYIARHFGDGPHNVFAMLDNHWLFWWRPMFSLLLSPGAQFGFTGFRLGYVALVALLAPAMWWWLRGRGVGRTASLVAGVLVALHPFLVVWGVRAFPDELMATLFVLGLAAWERSRHLLGAALLLAATWTKEVALVGVAVVLAEELLGGLRRSGRWELTLRVRARDALLAAVLALAYVPHLYAETIGGRSPGWSRGGTVWGAIDGAFTTWWFIPFVAAGLLHKASRRPAVLALAYLAFFAAYTAAGGFAEGWYFVLPTVLAVAAVCGAVDAQQRSPDRRERRLSRAAVAVAVAVVLVQVLAPASAGKQALLHPGTAAIELSYGEAVRAERERDQDLWLALDTLHGDDLHNVLLVDVAWFFAIWPLSERADFVATAYTHGSVPDTVWGDAIELVANTTLLHREATPLSLAVREVYADCITRGDREYIVLRGQACPGRLEQLRERHDELAAASA